MPILYANPEYLRYFEHYTQKLLEKNGNSSSFTSRVGDIMAKKLSEGEIIIPDVAGELSIIHVPTVRWERGVCIHNSEGHSEY